MVVRSAQPLWHQYGADFHLAQCLNCGFSFTDPYPSADILKTHYTNAYNYGWFRSHLPAKRLDAKIRLLEVKPWLQGPILDYGGGLGYLSEMARKIGFEAITYDPYTANKDNRVTDRRWQTIFCLHVLEHSVEPSVLLQSLRGLLAPGGHLILTVPNYAGLAARSLRADWHWFQGPISHVSHFTAQALCQMAHRNGFSLTGLSFHDRWDANRAADLYDIGTTRAQEREWEQESDPERRQIIACRNSRYRYAKLRSLKDRRQDNADLSEILLVATPKE